MLGGGRVERTFALVRFRTETFSLSVSVSLSVRTSVSVPIAKALLTAAQIADAKARGLLLSLHLKATMMIEYDDPVARKDALAKLKGVEDRVYVQFDGQPRAYAIADEDLDRENEEKTSSVHFLRFEFEPAAIAAAPSSSERIMIPVACRTPSCARR